MQVRDAAISNATITIGINAKLVSGAADWQVRSQLLDAAGSAIGGTSSYVDLVPSATLGRLLASLTTPTQAGAHGVALHFRRKTAAASTIRVGDLTVEVGATLGTWFTPVWIDLLVGSLGTAHASPSVSQAAAWVEEGVTNTDNDPIFGNASITNYHELVGSATIAKVTTFAYLGSAAGEAVCTASTSDGIQQKSTTGGAASNGQAWTFNGHIRAKASGDVGKTVVPVIIERDAADAEVTRHTGSAITLTDAPQEFVYTSALNGGGTVTKVTWALMNGAASACSFELLDKQLANKAYATSVAAGSLGTGYAWGGSSHASASTRTACHIATPTAKQDLSALRGSFFARAIRNVDSGLSQYLAGGIGPQNSLGSDWLGIRFSQGSPDSIALSSSSSNSGIDTASSGINAAVGTWYAVYAEWLDATFGVEVIGVGTHAVSTRVKPLGVAPTVAWSLGSNANTLHLDGQVGPIANFDEPLRASELAKVTDLASKGALAWDSLLRAA